MEFHEGGEGGGNCKIELEIMEFYEGGQGGGNDRIGSSEMMELKKLYLIVHTCHTVNAFGKEGVFHPIPQFSRHSIVWVVPLPKSKKMGERNVGE